MADIKLEGYVDVFGTDETGENVWAVRLNSPNSNHGEFWLTAFENESVAMNYAKDVEEIIKAWIKEES